MKMMIDSGFGSELLDQVRATEFPLRNVFGPAADRVTVEWIPVSTADGQLARLQVSDHDVSRSDDFTPADLAHEFHVRRRLSRLWDGVLAERSRLQAIRVRESLAAEGM